MNDAALLHALIVAAPDDFAVAHQDRADGNAALGQACFGFVNGGLQKWVHISFSRARRKWRLAHRLPQAQHRTTATGLKAKLIGRPEGGGREENCQSRQEAFGRRWRKRACRFIDAT